MLDPAEKDFLARQSDLEKAAVSVFERGGPAEVEAFLTAHARQCTTQVGSAYHSLVEYLMLEYLVGDDELATPPLPEITVPAAPRGK